MFRDTLDIVKCLLKTCCHVVNGNFTFIWNILSFNNSSHNIRCDTLYRQIT